MTQGVNDSSPRSSAILASSALKLFGCGSAAPCYSAGFLLLWAIIFVLLEGLTASRPVLAQESGNNKWFFGIAPYLYLSNIDGKQTIGGFAVPLEDTVLQNNFALRSEFGTGRLRGMFNFTRGQTEHSTQTTGMTMPEEKFNANYNFTWLTGELLLGLQIGPVERRFAVDLFFGGRYVLHKQMLAFPDTSISRATLTETWVEPVVGGRVFYEIGRRFWAMFSSDAGGFGIGSDFTWTIGGEAGFRVVKHLHLTMGYQFQEVQYDNKKSGDQHYTWDDGVQQGWFFGLIFEI